MTRMDDMGQNQNMVAYAIFHRMSLEDIFNMDAEAYPTSPMTGYIGWITRMTGEWDKIKARPGLVFKSFSDWLQYEAAAMNGFLSAQTFDPELNCHGYEDGQ